MSALGLCGRVMWSPCLLFQADALAALEINLVAELSLVFFTLGCLLPILGLRPLASYSGAPGLNLWHGIL